MPSNHRATAHRLVPPTLRPRLLALLLSLPWLALPTATVHAQTPAAMASPQQRYDVPTGPLARALTQFAAQAGIQVSVSSALTSGRHSPGVSGTHSLDSAFAALLAGTGLQITPRGDGEYTLQPQPHSEATLPTVAVAASAATTDGTTEGTGRYTTGVTSTATKMNLSIKDTPQSISVVTRQRMDDQALTDMVGVLEQTPGIIVNHTDGERYEIYSRGSAIDKFQMDGVTTSTQSGTQYTPQVQLDMALYDRVEVVRGATGLMTGAGVPSGVVNLVRKRPTREFQASVQGSVARWDDWRGEFDVSGPFTASGKVRGRLIASKQDKDSFTDRYGREKDIVYGVLEADLTDTTLVRFGVDYQKVHIEGVGGVPLMYSDGTQASFSRSTGVSAPWSYENYETYNYTLNLEQKLPNDWQIKLAGNYLDSDRNLSKANFGAYIDNAVNRTTNQAWVDSGNSEAKQQQKGLDITLQGPFSLFGRQHEAIVGFNYGRYKNTHVGLNGNTFKYDIADLANLNPFARIPDSTMYHDKLQRGYYGALRLNPMEHVHVIMGARSSDYTFDSRTVAATGVLWGSSSYSEKGEVTPYAGIVYDLTPQQSIYASYTDIFTPNSEVDINFQVLEPQVGANYEVGWKGEFHGGKLNANIAVYQVERDNVAEYVGRISGINVYRAISGMETKGIDMELAGEILPGWNLSASYSHSRSENRQGVRQFTYHPLDTLRLYTTWKLPGAWSKLTLGGGMNWNAKTSASYPLVNNGKARQDDYVVFNAMARYRFDRHLSVALNIDNLFDKTYYASIATYGYGYYGEPRNARLTLRYDF